MLQLLGCGLDASAEVQVFMARANQAAVQAAVDGGGAVDVGSGEFPLLKVVISKEGSLRGGSFFTPKGTEPIEAVFELPAVGYEFHGVRVFAQRDGAPVKRLLLSYRTGVRGSDPGVKVFGGKWWGHTSVAIYENRGSELFGSFGTEWTQDGSGGVLVFEELGSSSRYELHGCGVRRYGSVGPAVVLRGSIQEFQMFGGYVASKGVGITSASMGTGTSEVSGVMLMGTRFEVAGAGADLSATWFADSTFQNCRKGTIDGAGGAEPLVTLRKNARSVQLTNCRHLAGGPLRNEVVVAE